jgi:hypothetical protein
MTRERFMDLAREEEVRPDLAERLWAGIVWHELFDDCSPAAQEHLARDALQGLALLTARWREGRA